MDDAHRLGVHVFDMDAWCRTWRLAVQTSPSRVSLSFEAGYSPACAVVWLFMNSATSNKIPLGEARNWAVVDGVQGGIGDVESL
eukprot:7189567-Heterocapsa_arctica.AAC.1